MDYDELRAENERLKLKLQWVKSFYKQELQEVFARLELLYRILPEKAEMIYRRIRWAVEISGM